MSRIRIGWIGAALLLALTIPGIAAAQIEGNLSTYTGQNAEGYLTPLKEGAGAALQSGMFRSAAIPKNGLTFNLEVKAAFISFADGDRTFMAKTEEGFFPEQEVEAPTVIGDTLAVKVNGQGGTVAYFPGGFDVGSLGLAVPQLTIGGLAGSQLIARYIAVETGDAELGDIQLIGFGVRHSISQYFIDPPVDLAAGVMWQNFKLGDDLIDATALSFGAQASRRFGVLEPYLGLSYDSFDMSVDYEYGNTDPPTELAVDFEKTSDLHIAAGLGINLGFFHVHGEIGTASQTSYAVGVSLGN